MTHWTLFDYSMAGATVYIGLLILAIAVFALVSVYRNRPRSERE